MRPFGVPLALLLLLQTGLAAQVIGIGFKNENDARRFRKEMIEVDGEPLLVGEAVYGIEVDPIEGRLSKKASAKRIGVIAADPARPQLQLYERTRRGTLRVKSRRQMISIGHDVLKHGITLHWVMRYETLEGLREDYLRKKARLDEVEGRLRSLSIRDPEWFEVYTEMMTEIDTLSAWLDSTIFPVAGRHLQRLYRAKLRKLKKTASETRLESAKNSLTDYEPPSRLIAKSMELGRGDVGWKGRQTRHVRIVAHGGVEQATIDEALILAERIIEGFRSRFVDPLLKSGDEDPIPEGLFVEFFFAPSDVQFWVKLYRTYYGKQLPSMPDGRVNVVKGLNSRHGADGVDYLRYWRNDSDQDIQGIIANGMGQILANVAYNGNAAAEAPAWVIQAWGYWISFEFLSRNTVTTFEWKKGDYERPTPKEGEKLVEKSLRGKFNERALSEGPLMSDLFRKLLTEMNSADLAKSWSVLDFLITKHPDKLDPLLKGACRSMTRSGRMDLERFRPRAGALFGIDAASTDVYKHLEQLWRATAELGQER